MSGNKQILPQEGTGSLTGDGESLLGAYAAPGSPSYSGGGNSGLISLGGDGGCPSEPLTLLTASQAFSVYVARSTRKRKRRRPNPETAKRKRLENQQRQGIMTAGGTLETETGNLLPAAATHYTDRPQSIPVGGTTSTQTVTGGTLINLPPPTGNSITTQWLDTWTTAGQANASKLPQNVSSKRQAQRAPRFGSPDLIKKCPTTENGGGRQYTQPRLTHLHVAVTTKPKSGFNNEQAMELFAALEVATIEYLKTQILANNIANPLKFHGKPRRRDGVLTVCCGDDFTLAWLKSTVANIPCPIPGRVLTVMAQSDMTRWVKTGLLLPASVETDIEWVCKFLILQNPEYNVHLWRLHRYEIQQDRGIFLIMTIPEKEIPKLLERERKINYIMGTVYVRFFTPYGLSDTPHEPLHRSVGAPSENKPSEYDRAASSSIDRTQIPAEPPCDSPKSSPSAGVSLNDFLTSSDVSWMKVEEEFSD